MSTITESKLRVGNFTSSEIAALMSNGKAKGTMGKPAFTYIEECNFERRLGRSLDSESNARPLAWGSLVENRVFELLGIEYEDTKKETLVHPDFDYWSGTPDVKKHDEGRTVGDIKSPMTLKSFCQLVQPIYNGLVGIEAINHVRENHKDGEKYYWQLVSNAVLTDSDFAELIIYVPYQSEIQAIRDLAANIDTEEQYRYKWIAFANDEELPYLPDGGHYKNLNVIRFAVPQADKDALTARVKEAKFHLIASQ